MLSLTRDKGEHARQAQLARAASKKDNTSSLPAKKAPLTAEPEDDPYDFGGANTTDADPYDFGGITASTTKATAEDPYDFGGVGGSASTTAKATPAAEPAVSSKAPASSKAGINARRRLAPAVNAATMKQTIGTLGIVRRAEEVSKENAKYADDGFEPEEPPQAATAASDQPAAAAPSSAAQPQAGGLMDQLGSMMGNPPPATGDAASLLARLEAARKRTAELTLKKADLSAAINKEQREKAEVQRQVEIAYDRLSTLLEGNPTVQTSVELDEDLDVMEAREVVTMLQGRLKAAKQVLAKHHETGEWMRTRRQLYEQNHSLPPSRPGIPQVQGGVYAPPKAKRATKEEREASVKWLYDESVRKKAMREQRAEEEKEKEIAGLIPQRRRLGKQEQSEVVKRFEGYAVRRRAREEAAVKKVDEEVEAAANAVSKGKKINLKEMQQRLSDNQSIRTKQVLLRAEKEAEQQRADAAGAATAKPRAKSAPRNNRSRDLRSGGNVPRARYLGEEMLTPMPRGGDMPRVITPGAAAAAGAGGGGGWRGAVGAAGGAGGMTMAASGSGPDLSMYDKSRASGLPDTPRTAAVGKLGAGKMLSNQELTMLRGSTTAADEAGGRYRDPPRSPNPIPSSSPAKKPPPPPPKQPPEPIFSPRTNANANAMSAAHGALEGGKMLTDGEKRLLKEAHHASSKDALPEPRPFQSEQFELTVPEGYVGGEDLPVALPDGRQVIVAIPDGLGEGDDFIALIPV